MQEPGPEEVYEEGYYQFEVELDNGVKVHPWVQASSSQDAMEMAQDRFGNRQYKIIRSEKERPDIGPEDVADEMDLY